MIHEKQVGWASQAQPNLLAGPIAVLWERGAIKSAVKLSFISSSTTTPSLRAPAKQSRRTALILLDCFAGARNDGKKSESIVHVPKVDRTFNHTQQLDAGLNKLDNRLFTDNGQTIAL